ncbi:MAG TPA: hypothetical protein ENK14_03925, partial [Caldithrix sp.]|nr:hypothetical protein [Caldithrix sp.]
MNKFAAAIIGVLLITSALVSQTFFTAGAGFTKTFLHSQDLNQFRESYNAVQRQFLVHPLAGFGGGFGLQAAVGLRRYASLSGALKLGFVQWKGNDFARFSNGDKRDLQLESNSFYLDVELGQGFQNFFVNGLLRILLSPHYTLRSSYSTLISPAPAKSLDGRYENKMSTAVATGVSIGLIKEPIIVIAQITYVLYKSGTKDLLRESDEKK